MDYNINFSIFALFISNALLLIMVFRSMKRIQILGLSIINHHARNINMETSIGNNISEITILQSRARNMETENEDIKNVLRSESQSDDTAIKEKLAYLEKELKLIKEI